MIGICITIVFGLIFYWIRSHRLSVYGIVEVAVSLGVIVLTFYPQTFALLFQEPPLWGFLLSHGVGVLAGIYLMVTGLDHISTGRVH